MCVRNGMEWEILLGRQLMVSLFFYNQGIDTGDIIQTQSILNQPRSIKHMRKLAHKVGWKLIYNFFQDPKPFLDASNSQKISDGITYYTMCPALYEYTEYKLSGFNSNRIRAESFLSKYLRN